MSNDLCENVRFLTKGNIGGPFKIYVVSLAQINLYKISKSKIRGIFLIQELRKALQQLQGELQSKSQQLCTLEAEKYNEIRTQEQHIQHLNHSLSHKERLLQVSHAVISSKTGLGELTFLFM